MAEMWCKRATYFAPSEMGNAGPRRAVLAPADALSAETLFNLPEGITLRVEARQSRSGPNHRHFFALIHKVWENLPDSVVMTEEDLREQLLIMAGYHRTYVDLQGNTHVRARSINYATLDETAFKNLKDAVVKVIVTKVIPGFDTEAAEMEVMEMLR